MLLKLCWYDNDDEWRETHFDNYTDLEYWVKLIHSIGLSTVVYRNGRLVVKTNNGDWLDIPTSSA